DFRFHPGGLRIRRHRLVVVLHRAFRRPRLSRGPPPSGLEQTEPPQEEGARAEEAARRRDVGERDAEQRRRPRQKPERKTQGQADERRRERLLPRPPPETVVEDVRG